MILKSMGVECKKDDMDNYSGEVDEEGSGKFTFMMFCQVSAKFMIEDDEEQMKEELKEGHRHLRPCASAEAIPKNPNQVGQRAREEVQWKACGVHCPEAHSGQAHQEGQQAEAEETKVKNSAVCPQLYPG